jgi:metallo-beta-lactamase class B
MSAACQRLITNIVLARHREMATFWERVATRKGSDADALIDPAACRAYAKVARELFEAKLAKQRENAASVK